MHFNTPHPIFGIVRLISFTRLYINQLIRRSDVQNFLSVFHSQLTFILFSFRLNFLFDFEKFELTLNAQIRFINMRSSIFIQLDTIDCSNMCIKLRLPCTWINNPLSEQLDKQFRLINLSSQHPDIFRFRRPALWYLSKRKHHFLKHKLILIPLDELVTILFTHIATQNISHVLTVPTARLLDFQRELLSSQHHWLFCEWFNGQTASKYFNFAISDCLHLIHCAFVFEYHNDVFLT